MRDFHQETDPRRQSQIKPIVDRLAMNHSIRMIAVSNPGGSAKQFRIQIRDATQGGVWRQSAVTISRATAEELLANLRSRGLEARLVDHRLPAAA